MTNAPHFISAGMHGFLNVNTCEEFIAPKRKLTIQQRRESQEWIYYIAAEEIIWDYAPNLPDNVDRYTPNTFKQCMMPCVNCAYRYLVSSHIGIFGPRT